MNDARSPTTVFSEPADEQTVAYRSVSPLAVVALLLSAASALALAHPLLWLWPLAAILVSVLAIRSVAARPTELVGRGAAVAGLALAVLFGVLAPARLVSRQAYIYREAKPHADAWLELIRDGRLYEAFELHLPARERHHGLRLEQYYGDLSQIASGPRPERAPMQLQPDPKQIIRLFYTEPPMQSLLRGGKGAKLIFEGYESQNHNPESHSDDVTLRYKLEFEEQGRSRVAMLLVTLTRTYDAESRTATWHVANVAESSS